MQNKKLLRKGLLRLRLARKKQRNIPSQTQKTGLPPGSLIYTGEIKSEDFKLEVIEYSKDQFEKKEITEISSCKTYLKTGSNAWLNAMGINHVDKVGEIGSLFGMDSLLLEDLLNTQHRPKIEHFNNLVFLNIKMMSLGQNEDQLDIETEQISFALGKGWLLSFQEKEGDVFDPIRKRFQIEKSQIRKNGVDFLFYRLVDTIVDQYFLITEHISDRIEDLEDGIVINPKENFRLELQMLRKDLILLRKSVTPLREAIGNLAREENDFVEQTTMRYFHDVYEHVIQLHEYIDAERDMLASLADLYLSGINDKMNQIMKILTIISTIFIPLTFIAGVYGMNFVEMPELQYEYGYYGTLTLMAIIVVAMLIFFRKKKWI